MRREPNPLVSSISFGIRCAVAIVFGGAIPILAVVSAAAILRGGDVGGPAPLQVALVALSVLAVAAVIKVGAVGLHRLEKGWMPFLSYLGGVALIVQCVGVASRTF